MRRPFEMEQHQSISTRALSSRLYDLANRESKRYFALQSRTTESKSEDEESNRLRPTRQSSSSQYCNVEAGTVRVASRTMGPVAQNPEVPRSLLELALAALAPGLRLRIRSSYVNLCSNVCARRR